MQRRAAILFGILLACCPCASALNPSLDINQYAHHAWTIREGFFNGVISSIAQTPDGYLWLGTEYGLLRFDGVRHVPLQLPYGEHLPSNNIVKLLATRDGRLWIGTDKGLASWKSGKLTQYPELAGRVIFVLVEDRAGTVWAGTLSVPPPSKLCAIQKGSVRCYGEDGDLGPGVVGLFEDSKGNLWVGVVTGLWRWNPGPPKFYPLPGEPGGIQGLAEGNDGALLIYIRYRVRHGSSRLQGCCAIATVVCGSELSAVASCMYTREGPMCLHSLTVSLATMLPIASLRITKAIFG
jgi:ligand-binding sensor domain-containing protein